MQCLRLLVAGLMLVTPVAMADTQVNVVGLFNDKAVLVINGAAPRTLAAGQASPEGVKLVSSDSTQAVLEIEGHRKTLGMGQAASVGSASATAASGQQSMTLYANRDGHFFGEASINGKPVKFLLDTGATAVSMSSAQARRLGIDYVVGHESVSSTAAGLVKAWGVTLNSVKLGGMTLNQVDGVVIDGDSPPFVLLGMSALNRMEMKREGSIMTLTKKY
jgi:aspartyl protease family protein